ncbi:MAG: hypothetical protein J5I92_13985 [Thiogranum sp.]|nr:hypothetical protein [Thiogranum sp.]
MHRDAQLPERLQSLRNSVQHNCHISDARYASDYTLCVYLLKMREYYRWEKGYAYSDTLPQEQIGLWLTEREDFWETLENADFMPVEIDGRQYDPFDSDAINEALQEYQLLYSAGYGNKAKPHFYLARREKELVHKDYRIYVSAEEYARDLTAPPAMSLSNRIYIRRESLRRMLWEKIEEWRWNRPDNAMGRAIRYYDFDNDPDAALEAMTETEIDALVLHEIGEVKAGETLGDQWKEMIGSFPRSRLELLARAVRDHLADSLSTLPRLLEQNHPPSLHFYFANLSGIRKEIYPALLKAYDQWVKYGDTAELERQIESGREHWMRLAEQLMEIHESRVRTAWQKMETLIQSRSL